MAFQFDKIGNSVTELSGLWKFWRDSSFFSMSISTGQQKPPRPGVQRVPNIGSVALNGLFTVESLDSVRQRECGSSRIARWVEFDSTRWFHRDVFVWVPTESNRRRFELDSPICWRKREFGWSWIEDFSIWFFSNFGEIVESFWLHSDSRAFFVSLLFA